VLSRNTQGVTLIRLDTNEHLVGVVSLDEDLDEDIDEAVDADVSPEPNTSVQDDESV
jgi:DNA gyrase subunit A